jgi:PAS domain S-box-containing protein
MKKAIIEKISGAQGPVRGAEEQYRQVVENINEAIVVFQDDLPTFMNSKAIDISGYSREWLTTTPFLKMVHPEDRPMVRDRYVRRLKGEDAPNSYAFRIINGQGNTKWVEVNSVQITWAGKPAILISFYDVSERKKAEESLFLSEQKFAKIFQASPDWITISTLDQGKYIEVNEAYLNQTGYSRDEVIGHTSSELKLWVDPELRRKCVEKINREGGLRNFEVLFRMKSGEVRKLLWSVELIDIEGEKCLLALCRDVTELRKIEEQAQRYNELQTVINTLLRLSMEDIPLEIILDKAIDLILAVPWLVLESKGAIFLVEEDPETLVMKAQRGLNKTLQTTCSRVPFGRCLCGRAASTKGLVFADRLDERHDIYYESMVPHGHYCLPILYADRLLGVLNLYVSVGHGREPEEETFLSAVANTLASIIMRKQTERNLQDREERFRALFNQASDEILLLDPSTGQVPTIIEANVAAHTMHGYEVGELIGKAVSILDTEETIKQIPERMAQLLSNKIFLGETIHRRKDGSMFPVEISAQLITVRGKSYIQGIDRDITLRRMAEMELQESEDRYRDLVESSRDLMCTHDLKGKILWINEEPARILGYGKDAILKMNFRDLLVPERRDEFQDYLVALCTQGSAKGLMIIQTARGERRIWEFNNTLRTEGIKEPIVRGMARDVTEQKRAEREVRKTMEKLRKTMGGIIQVLSQTVEMRDPYTAGHQRRVADLGRAMAHEIGLSPEQVDGIRLAGGIHDLGKISVPAEILSKPTKLTELEFSLIKVHAESGYEILKDIEFPWPIARMVLEHHERMDGSGYPRGLQGEATLLSSRVLAVADVVEAIASHRPYRPAYGIEVALEEIEKNRGRLYDPLVVDICLELFRVKNYTLV